MPKKKASNATAYAEKWGENLRALGEKYKFDVDAVCGTKIPNLPQIRYRTAVSWFGGHRCPDALMLSVMQKVVSICAGKKVALKELLSDVDLPMRTRMDLETITGEKW